MSPCSVETLETTHPMTHHIPDDLNPFFIDVFLMSEWSVAYGDFHFWHIRIETLQKHVYQHCHIFLYMQQLEYH
jgi:hypothetical protein